MQFSTIMSALPGLSAEQLRTVIDAARALLAAPEEDPAEEQPQAEGGKRKRPSDARTWKETFYVGDYGPYERLCWREGGKKKSQYIGKVER